MNANAATRISRRTETPNRRLLVRMNATLFHCLGAAVLLESAAVAAAERHAVTGSNEVLLEEKRQRARWLRDYASSIWPEFAWDTACAAMRLPCDARHDAEESADGMATFTEQAALFYRTMSRIAEDPVLRSRLAEIAAIDECRLEHVEPRPAFGVFASLRRLRAARACAERCRDRIVRRAFELLQRHWADVPPFPPATYEQFLVRARMVFAPHLRLDWRQRLTLRTWLRPTRSSRGSTPRRAGDRAPRAIAALSSSCLAARGTAGLD